MYFQLKARPQLCSKVKNLNDFKHLCSLVEAKDSTGSFLLYRCLLCMRSNTGSTGKLLELQQTKYRIISSPTWCNIFYFLPEKQKVCSSRRPKLRVATQWLWSDWFQGGLKIIPSLFPVIQLAWPWRRRLGCCVTPCKQELTVKCWPPRNCSPTSQCAPGHAEKAF